jgi:hypothetical protein
MHVHMSTHTDYVTINTVLFKVGVLGTRGTIQTAEQLQLIATGHRIMTVWGSIPLRYIYVTMFIYTASVV